MKPSSVSAVLALFAMTAVNGFVPAPKTTFTKVVISTSTMEMASKGFGAPKEKKDKSQGQIDRDKKASKYDEVAAEGGQEYNIFVRQFGGDDQSWLPTGSIAVPRGAQVSDAIFSNEQGIKTSIVRTYPKLQGYEAEMEFGYNLKIYPDDPVEVATKGGAKSSGPSIGNWISNLLSPIDASGVAPPPIKE